MSAPGAFTEQIDLIQVLLIAFAIFFALLVVYLRREDKREGYPLVATGVRHPVIGWPAPPPPKTFRLIEGGQAEMPHRRVERVPPHVRNGIAEIGDSATQALGPGAPVERRDEPMRTLDGRPMLMPLRLATGWTLPRRELDPRGMRVLDRRYRAIGTVTDIWVDRTAKILRYFELRLDGGETMLAPIFYCHIRQYDREIRIPGVDTQRLSGVPRLANPDIMTAREEDRITAWFAGSERDAD